MSRKETTTDGTQITVCFQSHFNGKTFDREEEIEQTLSEKP